MIVTEKKSWLGLLFSIRGSTFAKIWPRVLFIFLFSTLIKLASVAELLQGSITPIPLTIVGLALAIFLGFRNDAAFDRFWEGRKLWGALVNVSRAFAIQTQVIKQNEESETATPCPTLVRMTIAYVNSLRHRLRKSDPETELRSFIDDPAEIDDLLKHQNVPVAVLNLMSSKLVGLWRDARLDTYHLPMLQKSVAGMLDVQGGCERIQSTPIPFTYSVLTHRTVSLYCIALPFGLHDTVGWAMPVVATFIAYAFLALDDLADQIEQPFGQQANALPLHSICRTIEINLLQLIRTPSQDLPEPIQATNDILD